MWGAVVKRVARDEGGWALGVVVAAVFMAGDCRWSEGGRVGEWTWTWIW